MSNYFSGADKIREDKLQEGIDKLKSRIRNVEVEHVAQPIQEAEVKPKREKLEIAQSMYDLYKSRVAPTAKEGDKLEVANTHALQANGRALARSLTNIRNGGAAGPFTEFTPQCNGDVNPGIHNNYAAMTVAGTEMTLEDKRETIEEYRERIDAQMEACWAGYKKKGMKTMFGKKYPNCVKEEELNEDPGFSQKDLKDHGPSDKENDIRALLVDKLKKDERDKQGKRNKKKDGDGEMKMRKKSDGGAVYTRESDVVDELKDRLLEMDSHSWQAIDKEMRALAKEHKMTPKELHKQFKAEEGMIPDQWVKENTMMEEAGYMPLDEAVAINQVGNVYEVTGMWRAHTRRIKFFVPTVGTPSKDDIQRYFEMFYPGGKVITFFPSMDRGDNIKNEIVVVVPIKEEFIQLEEQSWVQMSDEESWAYEMICEEEGEPTSPALITEKGFELWVEDHDTGEERVVVYEGGLHAWFSKSKSKDGKPGWVQSDGSPCANEKGETKTPKCYSSQRLAGLKKTSEGRKKIRSADARKSRQDSGQQSKSGGAKPTMVRTFTDKKDYKKHKSGDNSLKDESFNYDEAPVNFKVWPSAYTSDSLLKTQLVEDDMKGMTVKSGHKRSTESGAGLTEKGAAAYRRKNPGSKLGTAVTTPPSKLKPGSKAAGRRKSFCARSRGWTGERGKAARKRWNC